MKRKATLLLLFVATLLAGGAAAAHGQSALDGFDPNANGKVNVVVVQPDGKILLGGDFTTLAPNGGAPVIRNYMARLNPDGTLDTAFAPNIDPYPFNGVYSIALQADGKILIGGYFTSIGGQTRNNIARLDPTTGLADSFDPNANSAVYSVALQADGQILVGGVFTNIGGQTRNRIARVDAITGLADSFDPNARYEPGQPDGIVGSIRVQTDGKILVAGLFTNIGGQIRNHIARLDPTTSLADSFNPSANSRVSSIAVQTDGKILVCGNFTRIGGQTRNHIARLNPTSGLPDSFDPNARHQAGSVSGVSSIAVQADGRILASGLFTSIGGQPRNYIARLDPTTGLADSFDPNPNDIVVSIALQSDGKILAGGFFTGFGAQPRNGIARLETDGRLDQTLNLSIPVGNNISATAVQADGKILIGGRFTTILGVVRNNIARLNTDGTLDTAFNPNASNVVYSIAVQADGRILAGGFFSSIGGQTRHGIARLDATTGLADSFNPSANDDVNSIAVQADGKILVGGRFTNIGGQPRSCIARLDSTTGAADSFNPNANFNSNVNSIAVQADGKILVGGSFTNIGGQTRNHIARLDSTTGLADSFDPNANNLVIAIAAQADGKILASGLFTSIGGQTRHYIARLDPTTGLADSFNPDASAQVLSLAVQADSKILAGGVFGFIGGQTRNRIARLDATTGLADSFDPNANGTPGSVLVRSIAVQADGKILAGGEFRSIGGQTRSHFARLSNDTSAQQDLAVTQTTITWTRAGSSPQFTRVTFEYSNDNVNYTPLGGGAAGSNWILAGLNLPTGQNFWIRARGHYRSGQDNGSESITESVRNAFITGPTQAAQAINLSTRMRVETGDNVGIGGFIITGTAPKHLLLRAIGPSLTQVGVPNALADPVLELHGPGAFGPITNDNWRVDPAQEAAILASGIPPTNDLESAIDATLAPGAYTAILRGNGNTSGVALVEVYDLNPFIPAKLANISARAFVSTGDNIVVAGFMLGTNIGDDRIVVRGLGPSLTAAGVPDALADPTLELRDNNGALLIANNDWQDNPAQAAELTAAGLAPANQLESGIAARLPPGLYTAVLAGLNHGTGVGLVEVYDLGAP